MLGAGRQSVRMATVDVKGLSDLDPIFLEM